jgi:hypothetical protein
LRFDVGNAFETVFMDQLPSLESVLLTGLEKFFSLQDTSTIREEVPRLGTGIASGNVLDGEVAIPWKPPANFRLIYFKTTL